LNRLVLAALLSRRRELSHDERAAIIAGFPAKTTAIDPDIGMCLAEIDRELNRLNIIPASGSPWPSPRQLERGMAEARAWLDEGVFILTRDELRPVSETAVGLPPFFFARGSRPALGSPLTAILNSRKPRRVNPEDGWISVTRKLAEKAAEQGHGFVSSLGNYSYELLCRLARLTDSPTLVVCPDVLPFMLGRDKIRAFLSEYGGLFTPERTLFLSPFTPGRLPSEKDRAVIRDECVANIASRVFVGEIRPGGNMARLAGLAENAVLIRPTLDKPLKTPGRSVGKRPAEGPVKPALILSDLETESYLFHFTRSCPGPWPGQTRPEFYQALLDGGEGAAHTGFDALVRILKEKTVRASGRLIRGGASVVSFTGESLSGSPELIRWRPGLIRWTFEPYGLAVPEDILVELGAVPVIYGGEETWKALPDREKFRFQYHHPPVTDWSLEKEWRLPGDLDLSQIPADRIRVIAVRPAEAEFITALGYRAVLAGDFSSASG